MPPKASRDDAVAVNPRNMVQSLAKGFAVLQAFTPQEPELTLTETAARAGFDKATAFRMLTTLVHLGYVEKVAGTKRFRLTLKVLDLGFNAIARMDLGGLARPVLRNLVDAVKEAASVGVLDGTDMVYVERVQAGIVRLGVDVRVGTRIPAYCTAIGQAMLAWLPEEERDRILAASDMRKLTPRTPATLKEVAARLADARAQGYAVSDQEVVSGLRVLAAPVLDDDGYPLAALSVAAPVLHTSLEDFVDSAAAPVTEAAQRLSRAMQATGQFNIQSTASLG